MAPVTSSFASTQDDVTKWWFNKRLWLHSDVMVNQLFFSNFTNEKCMLTWWTYDDDYYAFTQIVEHVHFENVLICNSSNNLSNSLQMSTIQLPDDSHNRTI